MLPIHLLTQMGLTGLMVSDHREKGDIDRSRDLKKSLPLLLAGPGNHVAQMDEEPGAPSKNPLDQLSIDLFATLTVTDDSKPKRGLNRSDPLHIQSDLPDRSRVNLAWDEEN